MRIGIVGIGKMGSLFARYLADAHDVYVYDKDASRYDSLLNIANILDPSNMNDLDLVVIAVDLDATSKVIRDIAKGMSKGSILAEISSIKYNTHKALRLVCKRYDLKPLSLHPLFGQGLRTFKDARIILVPVFNADEEYEHAKALFKDANIMIMDAKEHDKSMAIALGLIHLANYIIARVIEKDYGKVKKVGGTTFKIQSILLESILNDELSLSISLMLSNPYMKSIAKKLKNVTNDTCDAIIVNDKSILNSYARVKSKIASISDLEESYRMMYKMLDCIEQ